MTADNASLFIAFFSLFISAVTAWLTLIRKGTVRATRPTLIYLGPDGTGGPPKVLVSTLLYATARRGAVVESMHVVLHHEGGRTAFTRWGYGEMESPMSSGLFVDRSGISTNHHFLLPGASYDYPFQQGHYILEIFASIVSHRSSKLMSRTEFSIPGQIAEGLEASDAALLLSWNPDDENYDLEFLDPSLPNNGAGV